MAKAGTAPETKTIAGKRYRYFRGFSSKAGAKKQARVLRSDYKSVRIVKAYYSSWGKPYTQYEVWVR